MVRRERYRIAAFGDQIKILDEFVAVTAYHRKHAVRVLREAVVRVHAARVSNGIYDEAVRQALAAADPDVGRCDGATRPSRSAPGHQGQGSAGRRKRRKGVGAAIRPSIPVRTFADWLDPPPIFFEIDMVEHCGGAKTDGDYVRTLTLTDIATGWTECVAMRVREQMLIFEAFDKGAIKLPFPCSAWTRTTTAPS